MRESLLLSEGGTLNTKKPDTEIKKPYAPPQLVVYGDVGQMTASHATSSNSDSGKNSMSPN